MPGLEDLRQMQFFWLKLGKDCLVTHWSRIAIVMIPSFYRRTIAGVVRLFFPEPRSKWQFLSPTSLGSWPFGLPVIRVVSPLSMGSLQRLSLYGPQSSCFDPSSAFSYCSLVPRNCIDHTFKLLSAWLMPESDSPSSDESSRCLWPEQVATTLPIGWNTVLATASISCQYV